tara:strand:- start:520 stop:1368 length:849 start_codon:yes stop_codon:yes gene_type:complete
MSLIKISLITSLLVLFIACGSESTTTSKVNKNWLLPTPVPIPTAKEVVREVIKEVPKVKVVERIVVVTATPTSTPIPTPVSSRPISTATTTFTPTSTPSPPTPVPTATPSDAPTPVKTKELQIQDWIKGLRKGTVTRVIDGDTIELSSGEKIRYLEVSTPEMSPLECYAQEATQKNSELVLGKTIYIQPPTKGAKESWERTLAYVFTDEYFVFLELVKNGYAIVELYASPNEFYDLLKQAENDARLNNRGLWGKCNSEKPSAAIKPTTTPISPTPTKDQKSE